MKPEDIERMRRRLNGFLYAERVTRILCRRSGDVPGYRWRETASYWNNEPVPAERMKNARASHRVPPLPFHSFKHLGPGFCRLCGQRIYGEGSFRSFAVSKHGRDSKRTWHSVCTTTYFMMTKPNDYVGVLAFRQNGLCAITGEPIAPPAREYLLRADADHEVPLYRVARDHEDEPWYELIRFWMTYNLRAITNEAHKAKNAFEARERAGRTVSAAQGALL